MDELTNEQKLIVLLSRMTISAEDEKAIKALLTEDIQWLRVLEFALLNKVVGLVFYNLERLQLGSHIHLLTYQAMRFYYLGTKQRNDVYMAERERIEAAFVKAGVPAIPLKGAVLIPTLYQDRGSRSINDLDFLIDFDQIQAVAEVMHSLGYVQGEYDRAHKVIRSFSRSKEVTWKLKMNNLPPFLLAHDSEIVRFTEIDFSFSLDLSKNIQSVQEMIAASSDNRLVPAHFFVHLCCHLYKEARGAIWILLNSDLNLIKFCDAREFILRFMNDADLDEAVSFAARHHLSEPLYFTLYFLRMIYGDGYETDYLRRLPIEDETFLNYFGDHDFEEKVEWQKPFWQRVFAFTNKESLLETQETFVKNHTEYQSF